MMVAAALLGYAVALAVAAPWLLAGWVDRAPRLAIAAWQAVTVSIVGAVVLGALALTFPTVQMSGNLADLLRECFLAVRAHYASPGGGVTAVLGVALALAVVGRVVWCTAAALARAAATRGLLRDMLAVVGRPGPDRQTVVVDHEVPAAYCLPGARRRIVVTSSALAALDDEQLHAVLAHERAHLRGRHDLVIAGALALARAFPPIAVFHRAHAEVLRLVELLADDAAVRGSDRLTLAEALLAVGGGGPAGALAAGGSAAGARVRRLITGHRPIGRRGTAMGSTAVAALLTVPVLLLAAPAALALGSHPCPHRPAMTQHMAGQAACPIKDCAHSVR